MSGERFKWEMDRVKVIDNSFPHHTWNDSDEDRVIFYFDFFHPELTQVRHRHVRTQHRFEIFLLLFLVFSLTLARFC